MKKILAFLILLIFTTSCESFRVSKYQVYSESVSVPYKFELITNQIHCDVYSNGLKYDFLFDTGANMTIVFNDSLQNQAKLYGESKEMKFAYQNSSLYKKATSDLDFQFLAVQQKEVRLGKFPQSSKCSEINFDGLIGGGLFNHYFNDTTKYIYSLNFSDSTITVYDTLSDVKDFISFDTVPSKFSVSRFSIFIDIKGNDKPLKFLFDTGFDYSMIISDSNIYNNISDKDSISTHQKLLFLETKEGDVFNKKMMKMELCKTNFSLNNYSLKEAVFHSTIFRNNIIGIQLIKHFDWIIDFKHKVVYCRPNNLNHNMKDVFSIYHDLNYSISVHQNKLYINQVNEKFTKYKLGAIIKSVNGTLVTKENICEMESLVNSKPDEVVLEFEENFIEEAK